MVTRFLSVVLAVTVGAVAASGAVSSERPTSERGVAGPSPVARASLGAADPKADAAKVYYSDANSFDPSTPFFEYDVASDSWAEMAPLVTTNTTQLASDENGVVYSLPEDGKIYAYDRPSNTWIFVMDGPPPAVGRNAVSMFEANGGEFYWAKDATTTLYYTVGGVWNSISTPRTLSSGAATDRDTGLIYVRTYSELGFSAFDPTGPSFPQICDYGSGVAENSRVGAYFDGEFYTREQSGTYQAIDIATCDVRDTGTAPNSSHSATGEDTEGNIYSNGWTDDTVFELYDAVTNDLNGLAPAPDIPDNSHSTLVAATPAGCALNVLLPQTRLAAGELASFIIDLDHRRPKTVTVRVNVWVENLEGVKVLRGKARTFTFRYRDHMRLHGSLELPTLLPLGRYRLHVEVGQMRQGTATAQGTFEIVER